MITFHQLTVEGSRVENKQLEAAWPKLEPKTALAKVDQQRRAFNNMADQVLPGSAALMAEVGEVIADYLTHIGLSKCNEVVEAVNEILVGASVPKVILAAKQRPVLHELYAQLIAHGPVLTYSGLAVSRVVGAAYRFQNHDACRVFLAEPGGLAPSIVLSQADALFFVSPSWKAAENAQVVLNATRGRTKPLRVFFVSAGCSDAAANRVLRTRCEGLVFAEKNVA